MNHDEIYKCFLKSIHLFSLNHFSTYNVNKMIELCYEYIHDHEDDHEYETDSGYTSESENENPI